MVNIDHFNRAIILVFDLPAEQLQRKISLENSQNSVGIEIVGGPLNAESFEKSKSKLGLSH